MNSERAVAYRKQAAALLEAVLAEDITPRAALNCWPTFGNQDPSVRCAYTMLWYFESDEDRHQRELFYSDLQIKNLRDACQFLKRGEPLSIQVLREYQGYEAPGEHQASWTWRQPLWWLRRQVESVLAILYTSPWMKSANKTVKTKGPRFKTRP